MQKYLALLRFLFVCGFVSFGWALDGTRTARPMAYDPANAPHYGYMEYLPAGYATSGKTYPLVVFLHGIGERGNGTSDLSRVENNGPPRMVKEGRDFPAIIISPQAPPSGVGWFWHRYIVDMITYSKSRYRIDPDRVYVTGLSAGGGTAWAISDENPGSVCALAVICGADEVTNFSKLGAGLRRLPLWAFHNNDDTTVYPSKTQRNVNQIIKQNTGLTTDVLANRPAFPNTNSGTAFTAAFSGTTWSWTAGVVDRSPNYPMYTLYASGGHDSWTKTYNNQAFWDWLFAQKNHAPTMSILNDRTVAANGSTGAMALIIDDADMHPDYLVLTRTSSNTTVVPLDNVVLGGSGGTRQVTVTGASVGTSIITVTVSDGIRSTYDSFILTVNNEFTTNNPPTISGIPDSATTTATSTGAIDFTIGDDQTALSSLTLSKGSSNQTLVPLGAVTFGGTNGARTVTITPSAGKTGVSTITVGVSDGSLTTSTSFKLTVSSAVNVAPYISQISNQSIASGTSTAALDFQIRDAESSASDLILTRESSNTALVSLTSIVFAGSGENRTVVVTPIAGQVGQSTIRIRVDDGALTASKTFVLTVTAAPVVVDLRFNFQPAVSTIPAGMLADTGGTYANHSGTSYGWNQDLRSATRRRNDGGSADTAHDTLIYVPTGAKWECALPNATYEVRVVAGDPRFSNGTFNFLVEGVSAMNGSPTTGSRWLDQTVTVSVQDGRLTITQGSGAEHGKICLIEILAVGSNG